MTPPLLKVLCEAEGIWGEEEGVEVLDEEEVIDIRRRTVVALDQDSDKSKLPPTPTKSGASPDEADDEGSDSRSGMLLDEEDSIRSARESLDNPSSDYHASAEDDASSSFFEDRSGAVAEVRRRRGNTIERPSVPTVYLDSRSHLSSSSTSSLQDPCSIPKDGEMERHHSHSHSRDGATDDKSISSGPYSNYMAHPDSPVLFSSSAESVATPTSSNPSFVHISMNGSVEEQKKEKDHPHQQIHQRHALALELAEPTPLELRPRQAGKKPVISGPRPIDPANPPVQFPSNPADETHPPLARRRSIPTLSLPSFGGSGTDGSTVQNSGTSPSGDKSLLRSKKPSLKLLFSKKSTSSLNGSDKDKERPHISAPILQHAISDRSSPRSVSDSSTSISTPLSAVTAPQSTSGMSARSSVSQLPPVLDTPIEGGELDFGFDLSPPTADVDSKSIPSATVAESTQPLRSKLVLPVIQPLSIVSRKSSESQVQPQHQRNWSQGEAEHEIRERASTPNLSGTSAHQLSLFNDDEDTGAEDWTQSVLLAAGTV